MEQEKGAEERRGGMKGRGGKEGRKENRRRGRRAGGEEGGQVSVSPGYIPASVSCTPAPACSLSLVSARVCSPAGSVTLGCRGLVPTAPDLFLAHFSYLASFGWMPAVMWVCTDVPL